MRGFKNENKQCESVKSWGFRRGSQAEQEQSPESEES